MAKLTNETINEEWQKSQEMKTDWSDDDGVLFKCKSCSRFLPVKLKSKIIGRCKQCAGEQ